MQLNVRTAPGHVTALVLETGAAVAKLANGSTVRLPSVWLRDNCVCDECRIAQTGEHRYFLGTSETLPHAEDMTILAGDLLIVWSDGHKSQYRPADIASLLATANRSHRKARLWSRGFSPQRFDYATVLAGGDHQLEFLHALIADGCVLVTASPTESGTCIEFLEAIGVPIRDTPFDRLHDVYFHADGYNVAHTDEPLPPHTDFASYQWPPSGQVLHMLVNEVSGGESVLVDGWRVLTDLRATDPEAVDVLARVGVGFREHSDTAESWTTAPIVRLAPDGDIAGIRFSNQLMQPLDPAEPEIEAFYEAYHKLARALTDPANQAVFRTNGGEMQIVHSHRVLHARRGFEGRSGSRHLQDTYFEFDDLAALAALIAGDIPGGH